MHQERRDDGRERDDHTHLAVLLTGWVDAERLVRNLEREPLVPAGRDLGDTADLDRGAGVGEVEDRQADPGVAVEVAAPAGAPMEENSTVPPSRLTQATGFCG
ncbi:hypothetical protein [Streptomyces blattellae]|uniref:hypothetical protein n=1 Tax=Streptomyces blattellae TaxID=2569855 RepID=UPI0012B881A9|nr:hypothetical protein [Streptomyces blattellae]